uniref:carnosine N-methyltransferase n=1 Tax=Phallusia mammillata TaxID=59560 RepID=A0A6F9D8P9_9ASCI|nr:UPF0586 protein C9orf41 [Phallusia mammillata]
MDANGTSSKEEDTQEEVYHFMRVFNAFKAYRRTALHALDAREKNFEAILESHKLMLPNHRKIFDDTRLCIDCNAAVIKEIIKSCGDVFENKQYSEIQEHVSHSSFDSDKVKSTLKQIARDWSSDGANERLTSYQPIIEEIKKHIPLVHNNVEGFKDVTVLVPGCGLGRLAWELAKLGYITQGNEFSFYMLFTSSFIINQTQADGPDDFHQFTIYPWIDKTCNNISWADALKRIKFPDVNPGSLPFTNKFTMTAGDFLEVYTTEDTWDCVATCYFIDTAHNIVTYIERIFSILKPGGFWINLGPLLYHFSGMAKESSIELSYEEVVSVIKQVGFKILKEDWIKGTYTNNCRSMLQYEYNCVLLVATKPMQQT